RPRAVAPLPGGSPPRQPEARSPYLRSTLIARRFKSVNSRARSAQQITDTASTHRTIHGETFAAARGGFTDNEKRRNAFAQSGGIREQMAHTWAGCGPR